MDRGGSFAKALDRARPLAGALAGAGRAVLDLALPPTCISCGAIMRDAGGLCGACWGRMTLISPPVCHRLGTPFAIPPPPGDGPPVSAEALADPPAFDRARAAVLFGAVSRDLVHRLKYGDRLDLAAPMARLMAQAAPDLVREADVIVPVPLHLFRLWRRRFNQSALLARNLAAASGNPVHVEALQRVRPTSSQVALSRAERRANVSGAFRVPAMAAPAVAGRRVLLVDDVLTTGATLDACARMLRRSGASGVDALTFARVVEDW